MSEKIEQLLENGPRAVNIGVADFADSLHRQGADVVQVTWTPPADGDAEMDAILAQLL